MAVGLFLRMSRGEVILERGRNLPQNPLSPQNRVMSGRPKPEKCLSFETGHPFVIPLISTGDYAMIILAQIASRKFCEELFEKTF